MTIVTAVDGESIVIWKIDRQNRVKIVKKKKPKNKMSSQVAITIFIS